MATAPNANIIIPYSPFLDETTGRPSQPWLQWLLNPSVISINLGSALGVTSGGTGLTTIPTNGQLLIGNGTGYTLNTLGFGAGISVTNGSGTISVANTGVLSFSAGTTGLTPSTATTGVVSLAGTLIAVNGGTGFSSYAVGDLLYADTTTTLAKLPDVATGNALISGGVSTAPTWGKIGLTTHVSGILPIANGGTNSTATPTAYGISYGTGTAYAFTAAGTDKQVLRANTGAAPTWTTLTTGTSILYGDNTGGFSNVTIGSGVSFVAGTLSAAGSGGTVTSVSGTGTVSGISLSGTVTSSGSLTLGGTLDLSSPPAIGSTAANTGAFTTLSASSTVSGTGFTTYLASPPAIGGTTAAAGTFTALIGGSGSANYEQITGGATGKAVQFQSLGSDAAVSLAIQSKGTGAIDLAAGSSGVNISNGGTVTAITRTNGGTGYTVAPTVVISAPTTAGGVQATATCTVTAGVVDTAFTITNAGSGYVEQPTITFTPVSGGSGAAAYAVIGAEPTFKSLFGSTSAGLAFSTAYGPQLRLLDIGDGTRPLLINGGSAAGAQTTGITATAILGISAGGGNSVSFYTNGRVTTEQFRVSHTSSAVNYVQVTGAATGGNPSIVSAGSDGAINLSLSSKSTSSVFFYTNNLSTNSRQLDITHTSTVVNRFSITGAQTGNPVVLGVNGNDADIDVAFTPKGAGTVRFGTYTVSALLAVAGYITIKDSGGTTRRLLVG